MNGNSPALSFYDTEPVERDLEELVLEGLSRPRRALPPKLLYDRRGAALFEAICRTPEYYVTRTEAALLTHNAEAIARALGRRSVVLEPGAGGCGKIRLLLSALRPVAYLPVDISRGQLLASAQALARDHPWLRVVATCADFSQLDAPPPGPPAGRRVCFFPGSTIGNFEPGEAEALLARFAHWTGPGGGLLIGVDLKKEAARLNAAYNDAAGVTAAFNLNLLLRLNRELGADFEPTRFRHHAFYDAAVGRVEMHLQSRIEQTVELLGRPLRFAAGEGIHTENSYKYTVEEFSELAGRAGWAAREVWVDADRLFSVHYCEVAPACAWQAGGV